MFYFLSYYFLFVLLFCSSLPNGFVLKASILRLRAASLLSSTNIPNEKLQSIPPQLYNGLLTGLNDVSLASYYSMNLPIKQAAELVKNNRHLYDIIETECQSDPVKIKNRLEEIENYMDTFMEKNNVWDRKDLFQGLEDVARKKGNFVCLLGGKSTGKSLVLQKFSMQNKENRKVIYIDMRSDYASITHGFLSVINKEDNDDYWKKLILAFLQKSGALKFKLNGSEIDFNAFLGIAKEEKRPNEILESLIEEMLREKPTEVITLVIDEANSPFTIYDGTNEAKVEEVRTSLKLFTRLTKQKQMVSVNITNYIIIINYKIRFLLS